MLINLKIHQLRCQVVSLKMGWWTATKKERNLPTNQDSALRAATTTLGNLFQSTRSENIPLISIFIINLFKSSHNPNHHQMVRPVVADTSTRDSHLKRLLHSHSSLMMRTNHIWFSKLFFLSLTPLTEWTLFVMIFTQSMTSGYLLFPEKRITNASHSASKAFVNLRL